MYVVLSWVTSGILNTKLAKRGTTMETIGSLPGLAGQFFLFKGGLVCCHASTFTNSRLAQGPKSDGLSTRTLAEGCPAGRQADKCKIYRLLVRPNNILINSIAVLMPKPPQNLQHRLPSWGLLRGAAQGFSLRSFGVDIGSHPCCKRPRLVGRPLLSPGQRLPQQHLNPQPRPKPLKSCRLDHSQDRGKHRTCRQARAADVRPSFVALRVAPPVLPRKNKTSPPP